ncbi:hypothetical protein [Tenggerimyces flavus]|uniref:Uncharacterized protein n=1 Tax=Tenggerimyces flavus TaxID=1708749 RepID=A0ABV7YMI6_9ACTN|nr:hypothetical protein [Tenggerimyces flavus]MBM7787787.1 hypothetical protein [Tenggerimyces flavus]
MNAAIEVGARVKLTHFPDVVVVVEVLEVCPDPGCGKPALRVRRAPGRLALWHAEDCVAVEDGSFAARTDHAFDEARRRLRALTEAATDEEAEFALELIERVVRLATACTDRQSPTDGERS